MALGLNRKYNNLCGLPISEANLIRDGSTEDPIRGAAVVVGDGDAATYGVAGVVETAPKANTAAVGGLPTGTDAEQYIIDFGPSVWQLDGSANAAIGVGDKLNVCVGHEVDANTAGYHPGYVTDRGAVDGKIIAPVGGLVALSALGAGNEGKIDVMVMPIPGTVTHA